MSNQHTTLTIKKDGNKLVFFVLGLFYTGMSVMLFAIIIRSLIRWDDSSVGFPLDVFLLCTAFLILPSGLFCLSYAFGDRQIFAIEESGIIAKKRSIKWNEIYEIETTKYPGPKMRIYRIRIYHGNNEKTIIWFSSDINVEWNDIEGCLGPYVVRYQICWN